MEDVRRGRAWSRRSLLRYGAGGLGAFGALLLAGCGAPAAAPAASGSKPAEPSKPAESSKPAEASKPAAGSGAAPTTAQAGKPAAGTLTSDNVTMVFMHHLAGDKEQAAYDQTYEKWNEKYPNIKLESMVVPDQERLPKAQAMVAADQAPDMWRHGSNTIRLWAHQGHLLDLTDLLPADYGKNFLPALASYCQYKGRYFGLPHTTDTSALFYRQDAMEAIGVTPPTELKDAWTFQQFGEINEKLLGVKKQQYAFTHNQGYSSRWMPSFLYATGGKIVTDDFSKMSINNPEGIAALKFIKDWTDKKWAPPAIWTTRVPNEECDQFIRGTASMAILGQWNINYLDANIKDQFKWGVTFIPRDKQQTTSLGGTPIVVWKKAKYPKEAAAFFEFFTSVEMLKLFDETANFMPVRSDMMAGQQMKFQVRDDLMQTFHKQIGTMPPAYAAYVARSYSSGVNPIVVEETSKMVLEGQSAEDTARRLEERGNAYIQENPDVETR